MSGTKVHSNYEDLLTFTRASKGHALRPVSYGAEQSPNATFTGNIDGWRALNAKATATAENNELKVVTTGISGAVLNSSITLEIGKIYRVSATSTSATVNHMIRLGSTSATSSDILSGTQSSVPTTFRHTFVAASDVLWIYLRNVGAGTVTWDNISVKEVTFDQPDGTLTLFEHPDDVPRVEYDADGNRLGLLVEEQRVNSLLRSNEVTTSPWTSSTTATQNLTGPDGISNSGWTLEDSSTSTFEQNTQSVSITANTNTHCVSFFIKKDNDESRFPEFQIVMGGNFFVQMNTKTGATYSRTNQISGTSDVEDYGEWWRVIMTATNGGSATSLLFKVIPAVSAALGNTVLATLTGSIGFYGGQVELNASFPTSYIKTTVETATRSADVASIPVADFGFNADEGTLFAELRAEDTSSTTGHTFYSLKKDTSNYVRLDRYSAGFALRVRDGGTYSVQAQIPGGEPNTTDLHKVSAAYKANDFAYVYNGGTVGTDTSGTIPDGITTLHLSEGDFNGHIKKLMYIPRRLTNAQLVDLTS